MEIYLRGKLFRFAGARLLSNFLVDEFESQEYRRSRIFRFMGTEIKIGGAVGLTVGWKRSSRLKTGVWKLSWGF